MKTTPTQLSLMLASPQKLYTSPPIDRVNTISNKLPDQSLNVVEKKLSGTRPNVVVTGDLDMPATNQCRQLERSNKRLNIYNICCVTIQLHMIVVVVRGLMVITVFSLMQSSGSLRSKIH